MKVPLTKRFLAMGAEQSNILGDHKFPVSNCRIVVVGPKSGAPALAELANLPQDARILATGANVEELRKDGELFTEVCLQESLALNITMFRPMCCYFIPEMLKF